MELDTLNLTKMCRTCKCISPQMHPLFPGYENPDKSSRIDEMLMACTFVLVIRGDGLPDQICQVCLEQLQNAFAFKCRVERIDADLREYAKNVKVTEIKQELQDWNFIEDEMTDSASMTGGNNNDNDHDSNTEKVTDCLENEIESSSTQVKLEDTFDIENDYLEEDSVADIQRADLVPEKSKKQYENCYGEFKQWCDKRNAKAVSENILLAYLMEKSKVVKSSTLWSTYSMLKCMLSTREGIDVKKFLKLVPFLKKKSVGYQAKKSKVFTPDQINLFLKEANDEHYLLLKVVLIMGISGALRRDQLVKMTLDDIQEENTALIITVPDTDTNKKRVFTITNIDFIQIYRKYSALRPKHIATRRLFLRYEKGRCSAQVVGVHKIGKIPSMIANYLGLPNSEAYTGHCFRKSNATLLANTGAVGRHGGWKSSTMAEGYVEDSIENKTIISNSISGIETFNSNVNYSETLDLGTSVRSGVNM